MRSRSTAALVLSVLILAVVAALVVGVVALVKVSQRADTAAAVAAQIQDERARNIEQNCAEQNRRNRASVDELDRLLAQRSADASAEQVRRSRASTKALIDALVPVRDCDLVVAQQVQKNP